MIDMYDEEYYEKIAKKWKPKKVKIMFVAESPPKPKKNKADYFYDANSNLKVGLAKEINESLDFKFKDKKDFLTKFQKKGYLLIDIFPTYKKFDVFNNGAPSAQEKKEIIERFSFLINDNKPEKIIFICKRAVKLLSLPYPNYKNNKELFRDELRMVLKD